MVKYRKRILCGLIVAAAGIATAGGYMYKTHAQEQTSDVVESTEIEKKDLTKSVSITGVVQGKGIYNLASDVTDAKIKKMNVKVGDVVKKGQVLAEIDSSSVDDEIDKLEKEESAQVQKNKITDAAGERNVEGAKQNKNISIHRAQNELNKTEKDIRKYEDKSNKWKLKTEKFRQKYEKSKKQITALKKQEDQLIKDGRNGEREVNRLQRNLETAQNQVTAKENAWNTAQDNYKENNDKFADDPALQKELQGKADAAKKEWTDARQAAEAINKELTDKQDALNENKYQQEDIQKKISSLENKNSDYKTKLENGKSELKSYTENKKTSSAEKVKNNQSLQDAKREGTKNIEESNDSYRTAEIDAGVSGLDNDLQIKKLERQKQGAVIKAPCDGIVTDITASMGAIYKGDTLITVQDNSSYKITASIDQYHIGELANGMKAEIRSQADSSKVMTGKLTYIAQFAGGREDNNSGSTSGQTSGNANQTDTQDSYSVEVTPDQTDTSLKLGMKVKLTIIEKESKDTLVVPSDCIQEGSDGSTYVEMNDEDRTKVKVKTGLTTDYYTEIKGQEIKQGMEVVLPSVSDSDDTEEGGIMDALY